MASRLDDLLPLLTAGRAERHEPVAVVEVAGPAQLLELAADPKVRRYLLGRLTDTIALVDPGQEAALLKALRAGGHTPRVADGEPG